MMWMVLMRILFAELNSHNDYAEGMLCQEAIDALKTDTFSDLRAGLDAAQDIDLGGMT